MKLAILLLCVGVVVLWALAFRVIFFPRKKKAIKGRDECWNCGDLKCQYHGGKGLPFERGTCWKPKRKHVKKSKNIFDGAENWIPLPKNFGKIRPFKKRKR